MTTTNTKDAPALQTGADEATTNSTSSSKDTAHMDTPNDTDMYRRTDELCRQVPPAFRNNYGHVYVSTYPLVPAPIADVAFKAELIDETLDALDNTGDPVTITPAALKLLHDLGLVSDRDYRDAYRGCEVLVGAHVNGVKVLREVTLGLADDELDWDADPCTPTNATCTPPWHEYVAELANGGAK